MLKPVDIGMIQARRKKIAEEIAAEKQRHAKAVAFLEAEAAELEIAERVLTRLALEGGYRGIHPLDVDHARPSEEAEEPARKPDGIPSVPEMILESLRHAAGLGVRGLQGSGMTSYVQGRWWPEATINQIGPIAWRMWKRGDLEKDGPLYLLPGSEREMLLKKAAERAAEKRAAGKKETLVSG